MFLVLIMYMLLASTFTIGKAALVYAAPIYFIGVRMTISGILLLVSMYLFKRDQFRIHLKNDFWLLSQIAIFHIFISYTLEFWALAHHITAAKACFLYNLSPFVTALVAYLVCNERLTVRKWIGLLIGFLGFLPVLIVDSPAEAAEGGFFFLSMPEICLLGSAVAAVYGWVVMKKLVVERHYSPIVVNGFGMFWGGVLSFITSFIFEPKPLMRIGTISTGGNDLLFFILYTALLIIIANVIVYNLYGYLLRKYSATFLSLVGISAPFFAALIGWFVHGESVTSAFYISSVIVFLGLYIFYIDEKKAPVV